MRRFSSCLAATFFVLAAWTSTVNGQDLFFDEDFDGPRLGTATTLPGIPVMDPYRFKVEGGWFCDTYDGYYDNDGEFVDLNYRENYGQFYLGTRVPVTRLGSDERPIRISAWARAALARVKFSDDEFSESRTGLSTLTVGAQGRMPITESFSASLNVSFVADIASEDEETGIFLTDDVNSLVVQLGGRTKFGNTKVGLDYWRVERLDENYVETNAVRLRGAHPVYQTEKLGLTAAIALLFHQDTDDGGHAFAAGLDAKLDIANSPLAFKIGGGVTEDWVPTGNYAFAGENYWQNKSLSISAYYKVQ